MVTSITEGHTTASLGKITKLRESLSQQNSYCTHTNANNSNINSDLMIKANTNG